MQTALLKDRRVQIAAGFVLLLLIALALRRTTIGPAGANIPTEAVNQPPAGATQETATATPQAPAAESAPTVPKQPTAPAPTSYSEALSLYGLTGYRIQFVNCSASPGSLVVKRGQKFMIDNRDAKAHVIAVGSAKYSLSAYGYRIVSTAQTGTLNITCDGGGAGRLTVNP